MPVPVTIVADGGLPVTESASGTPMTPVADPAPTGIPVTIIADGGIPVTFVNDDLSDYVAPP